MSVFHGIGGAWRPAASYWIGSGRAWRSVLARWVGVDGVWELKFSTAALVLVSAYVRATCPTPGTATAKWSIRSDGKVLAEWTNQTFLDSLFGADWLTPVAGMDGYEVRATKQSGNGTPTGSALGAWLNLGTTRSWELSTSVADVVSSCVLTVELRKVGDTSARVSQPITLSASVRTGGTPTYGTGANYGGNLTRPHFNQL